MRINLMLPSGQPAARTEIGLSTLDVQSLTMKIEVNGYDVDGNKRVTVYVPYQIETMREVTSEEIEAVVTDYFSKNTPKDES